jgi:hypothetical protein
VSPDPDAEAVMARDRDTRAGVDGAHGRHGADQVNPVPGRRSRTDGIVQRRVADRAAPPSLQTARSPANYVAEDSRSPVPGGLAEAFDAWRGPAAGVATSSYEPPQRPAPEAPFDDTVAPARERVQAVGLIQRRATDPAPSSDEVHAAAAAGLAGPAQEVPHRAALEASFGQDLGFVQAHLAGPATDASADMGAEAYATGDHVAFAKAPDLHTAAHEVAHVLQQRDGAVQLAGGVGAAGDSYEREADAAADAVVRGDSVERIAAGGGGGSAVQRRETTDDDAGGAGLPVGFEEMLGGTLAMTVAEGDAAAAQARAKLLRAQLRALHRKHRQALARRLEQPAKGDALAAAFQQRLSTPARGRLLAILHDEAPAATEEPAAAAPDGAAAAAPATLQSPDPAVNGRTVSDVGTELHGKAKNYGRFPAQQQDYANDNLRNEKRILDDHDGVLGSAINLFNDATAPDPERWRKAVVDWGVVQTHLQAVLALQPTATNINLMGELTEKGLAGWEAAMAQTSRNSDEMLRYLEGFSQAAKAVHSGVQLTSEILMAGAIACAVVLTGPAILAVGGQIVTTVGATGGTAAAIKGTTALVGAGLVGAGFKGTAQGGTQALIETGELIYDTQVKEKSFEQAAKDFDWSAVGDKGWQGAKSGFVDGVMAQGGLAIEAVANRFVGTVFAKFLGPQAGRLYARVLRTASERALSAGVAGGVSGALDAGARAALDGKSFPQIIAAMEDGAKLGAGLGAVFGGIFGAVGETRAARAAATADDVAPSGTTPEPAPTPAPARAVPDVEQLSPARYRPEAASSLDGTMEKQFLIDSETGQKYLFKPNRPDAPIPDRAVERGLTPDTIANRAKASEVAAREFDIETPKVSIVEYDGRVGSLQEWRSAENTYSVKELRFGQPELFARVEQSPAMTRLRSDLDTFDYVLNNLDRNDGNLLVTLDGDGNVLGLTAIDHDLTFTRTVDRLVDGGSWARGLPERYSSATVERLLGIAANPDGLRNALRVYLSPEEIEAALTRVNRILDDVDTKLATIGAEGTFLDASSLPPAGTPEPPVSATDGAPSAAVEPEHPLADDRVRGVAGVKPQLENVTESLDGVSYHNDVRRMSTEARHVIRQLEERGWVRVDSIRPEDAVAISKWFGKEIAIMQSPYAKLRVVLGERRGFVEKHIADGEVFVLHTHPVAVSRKEHFGIDLANAGKHVEAVIDWSGQITYYSKTGIINPISPLGFVEPLEGYSAAFLDATGSIVGFARVDIIDGPTGAVVKVTE